MDYLPMLATGWTMFGLGMWAGKIWGKEDPIEKDDVFMLLLCLLVGPTVLFIL